MGQREAQVSVITATDKLPDLLGENLRLVFVGTAASNRSADMGHYYAHPGNRFWGAIHEVGMTPRRYQPAEFRMLLPLGIGFTDLNKSESGMDHQLSAPAIDVAAFKTKIERLRPGAIAFTSKSAASHFYVTPTKMITLGKQPPQVEFPEVFVLSSPSGAASGHWTLQPWHELAKWFLAKEADQT